MSLFCHRLLSKVALIAMVILPKLAAGQTATPDPTPVAKPSSVSTAPQATSDAQGPKNNNGKKGAKGEGKKGKKGKGKGGGNGPGAVCKADRQLYCKDIKARRDRFACLQKNKDLLSPACKDFINTAALPGGRIPNPTPGPVPKSPDNKIEVNSAAPAIKSATPSASPAPKAAAPAPSAAPAAKPSPTPEKK